jgi:hypothetical protein
MILQRVRLHLFLEAKFLFTNFININNCSLKYCFTLSAFISIFEVLCNDLTLYL